MQHEGFFSHKTTSVVLTLSHHVLLVNYALAEYHSYTLAEYHGFVKKLCLVLFYSIISIKINKQTLVLHVM